MISRTWKLAYVIGREQPGKNAPNTWFPGTKNMRRTFGFLFIFHCSHNRRGFCVHHRHSKWNKTFGREQTEKNAPNVWFPGTKNMRRTLGKMLSLQETP
jgi:hypothetical protein